MTRFFIIVIIITSPLSVVAQTNAVIDYQLLKATDEESLSGAVWAIVNNDTIQTGAVGLKNVSSKALLKKEDKVLVGSITKTLIATGVLRLISQEKLDLNSPINQYIPDINIDNPWEDSSPITILHLLNHTSGIEDSRFWQVFSTKAKPNTPLEYLFTRNPSVLKVRTKPGTRFSYSNMGYSLLGLVIEKVTGQPYESYLDEHLLKPLGMVHSTFQFVSQEGLYKDESLAMGHFDNQNTQANLPMFLRPAGQFVTTANDMAILAKFLMSDGVISGNVFIDETLLRQIGKPDSTEANKNGLTTGYQYGLSYRDRYGVVGYFHRGNTIGYRATFYLFPEEKKAFFISFNMDSENADYEKFNRLFIEHLKVNKPPKRAVLNELPQNIDEYEGYYKINPIQFSKFGYLDLLFNYIQVQMESDRVKVKSLQNETFSLLPITGNLFKKEDRINPSHVLYKNDENAIISDGLLTYEKVSPIYLGLLWLSLVLGLLGIFLIIARGIYKLFKKQLFSSNQAIKFPFLSIVALIIPIPFLLLQPFLKLGELTLANILLAVFTGLLPLSMAVGLIKSFRIRTSQIDRISILATFQWLAVLIVRGLIPFRIWS
ncbi:serine hydrolase domain-containing protein [Allomuricauda sp. d1]|uniref:serine hydrolase domain-containing protein n=1 Tax=Allomuricauda sp. d1 TaxID=3136725 RepID=UPI0031D7E10B